MLLRYAHSAALLLVLTLGLTAQAPAVVPLPPVPTPGQEGEETETPKPATPPVAGARKRVTGQELITLEVAYIKLYPKPAADWQREWDRRFARRLNGRPIELFDVVDRTRKHEIAYAWLVPKVNPKTFFDDVKQRVAQEIALGRELRELQRRTNDPKRTKGFDFLKEARKLGFPTLQLKGVNRDQLMKNVFIGGPRMVQYVWGQGVARHLAGTDTLGQALVYRRLKEAKSQPYIPYIYDEPGNFLAVVRLLAIEDGPSK